MNGKDVNELESGFNSTKEKEQANFTNSTHVNERKGSEEQDKKIKSNTTNKMAHFRSDNIVHFSDLIKLTHPVFVPETEKKVILVVKPRNTEENKESKTTNQSDFHLLDDIASLALN